ncbi:MAG: CRISPR-associated endonuclease Cas2 [Anaerolineae bacterium]|jgi:CRISPR-associated protein Cas2|uniref:CRISPR-associated endonuclease Cas2 n=1 Tax=Candidatus Amarolinea dominans TaxID=3140696 RepID=UPI001D91F386|nr:CRISPR-associated endonuclease Cas2 [Anaerolineae bacterium]MBK9233787.1 CRISPR-associated endonuclease Cas2 [Anaerolineae bacterium]
MAKTTQFVLVCYDIPDDRRRTKVMQTLLDFGRRVQYSVFECDLKAKDLDRLLKKLGRLVDKTEDSVRFYFLCESCLPKALAMGAETEMGDARVVARIL